LTHNYEEAIAKAEENERKARLRGETLRRIATAEAEIPSLWDTGEVTQNQLVQQYGIAAVTVKRILRDSGRKVTRVKKLKDDDRAQVVALLRANENVMVLAQQFGVSQNTIRRVGLEAGVLEKGKRKPRRSDAEYELIQAFDTECRQRFGQGLYNLGIGLKTYHQRQNAKAEALKHSNETDPRPTYDPVLHDPNPVEDPDTQLGGNDSPAPVWPPTLEEPDEVQTWTPTVEPAPDQEDDVPFTPEPAPEEEPVEPAPLTEADFRQGFKAPGQPNF